MQRGIEQEGPEALPELGRQWRRPPEEGHDLQGEHAENGESDDAMVVLQAGFGWSPESKTHSEPSSSSQVAQCLQEALPLDFSLC